MYVRTCAYTNWQTGCKASQDRLIHSIPSLGLDATSYRQLIFQNYLVCIGQSRARHDRVYSLPSSNGDSNAAAAAATSEAHRTHKAQLLRQLHSAFVSRPQSICFPVRRDRLCHVCAQRIRVHDIIRLVDRWRLL